MPDWQKRKDALANKAKDYLVFGTEGSVRRVATLTAGVDELTRDRSAMMRKWRP
jgi:hypothetical protein